MKSSGCLDDGYLARWRSDEEYKLSCTFSTATLISEEYVSRLKAKAIEGESDAMVRLGELYLKGLGVERDEKQAYNWFVSAHKEESQVGTAWMADCLLAGLGVTQNITEGKRMLIEEASTEDSGEEQIAIIRSLLVSY